MLIINNLIDTLTLTFTLTSVLALTLTLTLTWFRFDSTSIIELRTSLCLSLCLCFFDFDANLDFDEDRFQIMILFLNQLWKRSNISIRLRDYRVTTFLVMTVSLLIVLSKKHKTTTTLRGTKQSLQVKNILQLNMHFDVDIDFDLISFRFNISNWTKN